MIGTVNAPLPMMFQECVNCGMVYGMPVSYEARRREDHRQFFCPSGHPQSYGSKTDAEKRVAELEAILARETAALRQCQTALKNAQKPPAPPPPTLPGKDASSPTMYGYRFDCDGKVLPIGDAVGWWVAKNPGKTRSEVVEGLWNLAKNARTRSNLSSAVRQAMNPTVGAARRRVTVAKDDRVYPNDQ